MFNTLTSKKKEKYFIYAIFNAVLNDNLVIFEWLVNEAERRDVDIRDLRYHGNEITLLMKARSIDMCMLLVEVYEFDIRTTLEMQIPLSPLMFFITFGLMDPAEYVIERGANVNEEYNGHTVSFI